MGVCGLIYHGFVMYVRRIFMLALTLFVGSDGVASVSLLSLFFADLSLCLGVHVISSWWLLYTFVRQCFFFIFFSFFFL